MWVGSCGWCGLKLMRATENQRALFACAARARSPNRTHTHTHTHTPGKASTASSCVCGREGAGRAQEKTSKDNGARRKKTTLHKLPSLPPARASPPPSLFPFFTTPFCTAHHHVGRGQRAGAGPDQRACCVGGDARERRPGETTGGPDRGKSTVSHTHSCTLPLIPTV